MMLLLNISLIFFISFTVAEHEFKICSLFLGEISRESLKDTQMMEKHTKILQKYDICCVQFNAEEGIAPDDYTLQILGRLNKALERNASYSIATGVDIDHAKVGFIFNRRKLDVSALSDAWDVGVSEPLSVKVTPKGIQDPKDHSFSIIGSYTDIKENDGHHSGTEKCFGPTISPLKYDYPGMICIKGENVQVVDHVEHKPPEDNHEISVKIKITHAQEEAAKKQRTH